MVEDVEFTRIVQSVYDGICELQYRQEEPTVILMGEDSYYHIRWRAVEGSSTVGIGMYGEITVFSVPVHLSSLLKNDEISVR